MQYNYELLASPVTMRELHDYGRQNPRIISSYDRIVQLVLPLSVGLFALAMIPTIMKIGIKNVSVFLIPVLLVFIVSKIIESHNKRVSIVRDIRLSRFAEANGLFYDTGLMVGNYSGMIFRVGSDQTYYGRLCNRSGNAFEISNFSYVKGSGRERRIINKGYIMIKLDHKLPNMVLDSKKNNLKFFGLNVSNLPVSFSQNQKLSLEGDFDDYFTLYAPVDYKIDALSIFTPDLMGLFIDQSVVFDAEIVDDNLFIYSNKFDMTDSKLLKKIFKIVDTVGRCALSKSDHYYDENVGRGIDRVSDPGIRLRKRLSFLNLGMNTNVYYIMLCLALIVMVYFLASNIPSSAFRRF